jgi:Spy/CpxP family protein refolding chaperone
MSSRNVVFSLILAAAFCVGATVSVHAGEDAPPGNAKHKGQHAGGGGAGRVHFILKHATDLKLTDDQKTKLQALADSVKDAKPADEADFKAKVEAILTAEQLDQLKSLAPKRGEGKDGGKDAGKDAPPAPAPGDDKK